MLTGNARIPTGEEFARNVLEKRDWVASEIAKMKDGGTPAREIRAWEKEQKSFNKMIADYGLERFA